VLVRVRQAEQESERAPFRVLCCALLSALEQRREKKRKKEKVKRERATKKKEKTSLAPPLSSLPLILFGPSTRLDLVLSFPP